MVAKSRNCNTARGNVRRGLYGDGRRNGTWDEEDDCSICYEDWD